METIQVETGRAYDVCIGAGLLDKAGTMIRETLGDRAATAALISDETVDALYGNRAAASLEAAGFRVVRFAFPVGEENKSLATFAGMLEFLAAERLTRSDIIVALGGGITGDMAGFAAASYLRGIEFVQMPTTLLAAVDSSVGGKTGVNLSAGKNLAGAFWQPSLVICDTDCFATLDEDRFADGLAEAIKAGIIDDPALFAEFEKPDCRERIASIVAQCVKFKARIVAADERESGLRQLLNLGHTFGHAIEKSTHHALTHGHAVAVGMVMASRAAEKHGICEAGVADTLRKVLTANNLPVSVNCTVRELTDAALSDKKRRGGRITLVLPEKIGACTLHTIPVEELESWIRDGEEA
ncbi:MAG: 3-dehydroquinate synthase [Ruminococcaceae bacterium]|nr:3-dehydroquinate synthase [Oscillospiraceae bacterium]